MVPVGKGTTTTATWGRHGDHMCHAVSADGRAAESPTIRCIGLVNPLKLLVFL